MRDRKLIRILGRMTAEERKEFAEFLRSPLHSHRPKLAEMAELMEEMLFSRPEAELSNEDFYQAVYPGKRYDPNDLNRSVSVILKELKDYLAFLQYRKDPAARYVYALREYADRKWADLTFAGMKEARMRLDTGIAEGEDYYYQHYQIGKVEGQYWVENMPKKPGLIYQPAMDRLDEFYALAKTKHMVLAINHDRIHDMEHRPRFQTHIKDHVSSSDFNSTLIRLFLRVYACRSNPESEELITKFIDTLNREIPHYDISGEQIESGPLISKEDSELLYGMAYNHCSELRHSKGNIWVPVLNDLLNVAIRKGVFLNNGKLYDGLFLTQIKMLCVTGFADLASEFFADFKSILSHNQSDSITDYSYALIEYFKTNFEESHKSLLGLKGRFGQFSNHVIANDCRLLLCMTWYRLGEIDSLIHELNAFRAHLNRDKFLSKDTNGSYKRFCKAMLSLERITGGKPIEKDKKLITLKKEVLRARINGKLLIIELIDLELTK